MVLVYRMRANWLTGEIHVGNSKFLNVQKTSTNIIFLSELLCNMTVCEWAESLEEEVFNYWKQNHNDWEGGFRVFYGPVFPEPELLILGYQPGGDPEDFERHHLDRLSNGDFSPPENHEYLENDYTIARRMREKVLKGENDLLVESVKSNAIFFRARDIDRWKGVPKEKRQDMENFSLQKVEEMVEALNPNSVLVEGMATWDLLKSRFDFEDECKVRRSNARLLCVSTNKNPTFTGIIHPSTRVSDKNWAKVRSELLPILKD